MNTEREGEKDHETCGGKGRGEEGKKSYHGLQKHAPHLLSCPDLHTEALPLRHNVHARVNFHVRVHADSHLRGQCLNLRRGPAAPRNPGSFALHAWSGAGRLSRQGKATQRNSIDLP
jgi:hypothetical protein